MSKQAIIKLTVELKEEGYTWDVIYEILQDGFKYFKIMINSFKNHGKEACDKDYDWPVSHIEK